MVPTPVVLAAAGDVYASYRASALWAPALNSATMVPPDTSVEPLLVGGTEYFLFQAQRGGAVTARMAFDTTGKLLEAEAVKTDSAVLRSFVDPRTAKWLALNRNTRLVWKPCLQSTSRLRPFWEISDGTTTRYMRVDGVVFDKLTVKIGIG